ncbi:molybdopterin converting factor subunit 1 [Paraglaciecola sp. 25GB23A]|uniref:molybdopterin converting factor subunit 1 n=1 Tax=Paraglaciecola sp. 25GB23A TaxID=3156068 RepID=UPI0032AED39A|tara:strand:+ start:1344 stop:1601 length:258 start_codon:yes stop_codon:yes gene_type:complete
MLSILFFGQLRERLNTERLTVDISTLVKPYTVASLFTYLSDKGLHWEELIRADNCLVAVNQTMATQNTLISADDEVALFPPVTGG